MSILFSCFTTYKLHEEIQNKIKNKKNKKSKTNIFYNWFAKKTSHNILNKYELQQIVVDLNNHKLISILLSTQYYEEITNFLHELISEKKKKN